MKVEFFLKANSLTICEEKDNWRSRTEQSYYFTKIDGWGYELQIGHKLQFMQDDPKKIAVVTNVIAISEHLVQVYVEANGILPTEHEFLRLENWKPTKPWK